MNRTFCWFFWTDKPDLNSTVIVDPLDSENESAASKGCDVQERRGGACLRDDFSETSPSRCSRLDPRIGQEELFQINPGLLNQQLTSSDPEIFGPGLWSPFASLGFPYFDGGPSHSGPFQRDILGGPMENLLSYQNSTSVPQLYVDIGDSHEIATSLRAPSPCASSPKDRFQDLNVSSPHGYSMDISPELVKELYVTCLKLFYPLLTHSL
jgi:hypothetical protein